MADEVAANAQYRQTLWSLATLPGCTVEVRGMDAHWPYVRVIWHLRKRWEFGVSIFGDDRTKAEVVSRDRSGAGSKRRVLVRNLIGTLTNWATDLDTEQVDKEALSARRDAERREARAAFRDTYGDLIQAADLTTRNKRTLRFEHHRLHENARHPEAGRFECQVTDQGVVHLEITTDGLPVGPEGRKSVLPTIMLLHTVLTAISECRASYAAEDKLKAVAEKAEAKAVSNG